MTDLRKYVEIKLKREVSDDFFHNDLLYMLDDHSHDGALFDIAQEVVIRVDLILAAQKKVFNQ